MRKQILAFKTIMFMVMAFFVVFGKKVEVHAFDTSSMEEWALGSSKKVNLEQENEKRYYKITPTKSGAYTIFSDVNSEIELCLYEAGQSESDSPLVDSWGNDNMPSKWEGINTCIHYNFQANKTYVLTVSGYKPKGYLYAKEDPNFKEKVWSGRFCYNLVFNKALLVGTNFAGSETQITIPDKLDGYPVIGIQEAAFENMPEVIKVTIPSSITYIDSSNFIDFPKLKQITIPEGVKKIYANSFDGIKEFHLPDSLEYIGENSIGVDLEGNVCADTIIYANTKSYAAEYAKKMGFILKTPIVEKVQTKKEPITPKTGTVLKKGNVQYKVLKKGKEVIYYKRVNTKNKVLVIPDTVKINGVTYKVTKVSNKIAKGNKNLTKIEIGKNVREIDAKAFYNCTNVRKIIIRSLHLNSKKIGKKAFYRTGYKKGKSLKVYVPAKKKKIYQKMLRKAGLSKKAKFYYLKKGGKNK